MIENCVMHKYMNDGKKVVTLTLNVVKSGLINNLEKFRGVIWLNRLLMTTFRVKLTTFLPSLI